MFLRIFIHKGGISGNLIISLMPLKSIGKDISYTFNKFSYGFKAFQYTFIEFSYTFIEFSWRFKAFSYTFIEFSYRFNGFSYRFKAIPNSFSLTLVSLFNKLCQKLNLTPRKKKANLEFVLFSTCRAAMNRECKQKTFVVFVLQRGRDSNPRCAFTHTHFPGVLLQPLGHLSLDCMFRTTQQNWDCEYRFFGY